MVVGLLKRVEWAEIDTDIGTDMFLCDCAEFGRKVKLSKPNDTTSYRNVSLSNSGSTTVPGAIRGNYYYDTTKGSRTGIVVNNRGNAYNLPRIESQNGIDTVYGGLGRNKYLKQLSKQTRPVRTIRKRGVKTYNNTRKVTQTIDTSPNTPSSTKSTYVPKKLSEVNTTPRQTSNPKVDKPQPKTTSNNPPPRQTVSTTSTPTQPKSSRKLLNKYSLGALGAAGVLGAGYLGYRAYQKRKKEDRK